LIRDTKERCDVPDRCGFRVDLPALGALGLQGGQKVQPQFPFLHEHRTGFALAFMTISAVAGLPRFAASWGR
jgi:hypothetical protein